MFTDRLNILFDTKRANRGDQILSLAEMTWDDYEKLTKEYSGYRSSYLHEVITIVSPSKNHERIAEIINGLVKTFCRKYNLPYFPMGSMTLKKPPLAGKKPDHSFAFQTDKSIPDLAIEVTYTNGSTTDLEKYQHLGVKEVWLWKNGKINFYSLTYGKYEAVETSVCLAPLTTDFIITFINRGLTKTPLTIEADFHQQLNLQ